MKISFFARLLVLLAILLCTVDIHAVVVPGMEVKIVASDAADSDFVSLSLLKRRTPGFKKRQLRVSYSTGFFHLFCVVFIMNIVK